jgi:protein SCO1/2
VSRRLAAPLALLALLALPAAAEYGRVPDSHFDAGLLSIDETRFLGAPLGGDLALLDEAGKRFTLGELFGKPTLLLFSYYSCDGACPAVNRQLAQTIGGVKRLRAGEDFRVLTLSFDPRDRPADLRKFVAAGGIEPGAGWRFALFAEAGDVKRIAESVGYRYFWSVRDRLFVHPAVLIVLSPEGRVARYLPAASIGPRDVELAIIESAGASATGIARIVDLAANACFSYSYKEGRYVLNAPLFVAAGSLTVGVGALILSFSVFRRFRRQEAHDA